MPNASYTYIKIDDDILPRTGESIGLQALSVNRTADGSVRLIFPQQLTAFQQANLTEFMSGRGYIQSPRASNLWTSTPIMTSETTLTSPGGWQVLGGCVLNSQTFFSDPKISAISVSGVLAASATGATLRLTEDDGHGSVVVLTPTPFAVPNTSSQRNTFQFTSQLPLRGGTMIYRLEAAAGLVIGATVGFVSLLLLESLAVDGSINGLQPPGAIPDQQPPPPPPPPPKGNKPQGPGQGH